MTGLLDAMNVTQRRSCLAHNKRIKSPPEMRGLGHQNYAAV
ncbi:hypothetical protein [Pseudoalteromonas sp. A757]|nr:hypothetical protein [Pseudoalteromonas sp. A757]